MVDMAADIGDLVGARVGAWKGYAKMGAGVSWSGRRAHGLFERKAGGSGATRPEVNRAASYRGGFRMKDFPGRGAARSTLNGDLGCFAEPILAVPRDGEAWVMFDSSRW